MDWWSKKLCRFADKGGISCKKSAKKRGYPQMYTAVEKELYNSSTPLYGIFFAFTGLKRRKKRVILGNVKKVICIVINS